MPNENFILPPPPRLVSTPLRYQLNLNATTLIGLAFLSLGLLAAGLLSKSLVIRWRLSHNKATTEGKVTSEGSHYVQDKNGGYTSYDYRYEFSTPDGRTIGDWRSFRFPALRRDVPVNIEYDPEHPSLYRLADMGSPEDFLPLVGAPIVLAGIVFMLVGYFGGRKRAAILERGLPAVATILSYWQQYGKAGRYIPIPPDFQPEKRLGWRKVRYGFNIPGGQYGGSDMLRLDMDTLSQQGQIPLLYDPAKPSNSILFGSLQPPPQLTMDGVWIEAPGTRPQVRMLWVYLFAALPVIATGLYWQSLLGGR